LNAKGMSTVRCQLLHYPVYAPSTPETPANVWLARSYIMFRIVGSTSPFAPTRLGGFIAFGGETPRATPLTSVRLLPVGVPVVVDIAGAGFDIVWVEFDTSSGTAGPQQGYDLVLTTFTGSGT
jgi:hypothetical protein